MEAEEDEDEDKVSRRRCKQMEAPWMWDAEISQDLVGEGAGPYTSD